jgi:hypothetical protein
MESGADTTHSNKSAQARLKTKRFAGASAKPSVREIDRIKTRFCRNPANPKIATKPTIPTVSASLKYTLNVEVISSISRDSLKLEMFVKFIVVLVLPVFL